MASVVFSSHHFDNSGREWTLEIYSLTTLTNTNKEMFLMSPGVELTYEMDTASLAKSLIGSSAKVTFQMTDEQMGKMNTLLSYDEGTVGLFLYRGGSPSNTNLEWAGHLLIESVSIYMHSEINTTSMTFTCGLSHLKYIDFKDEDGNLWWDRELLIRQIWRCIYRLPAQVMIRRRHPEGSYRFLHEYGLPAPVNPGTSYEEWDWTVSGMLSRLYVHSQTFGKPKDQKDRTRNLFEEAEFISSYDVMEDICKTLGACIAFTAGRYYMWNRTSVFNHVDDLTVLQGWSYQYILVSGSFYEVDGRPFISAGITFSPDFFVDYDINRRTLDGAVEGRTLPLKQVVMTHEDVEKDTIIAEGMSRRRFRWMDPTPGGFSINSAFNGYPGSYLAQAANDQYSYGPNRNYGYPYVFDFTLHDYEDTDVFPKWRNRLSTDDPMFRFGFPDRTNSQLAINGGQEMTFSFAGSIRLREHVDNAYTSFITITHPLSTTFVLKARIEAVDTDDNAYRLSRTVNVLDDDSLEVRPLHDPLAPNLPLDVNHKHKVYNDMNWLASDHEDYDDAWFEVMIPHGATANDEGDFENAIALIPGVFEEQSSYGGIFVEYNEEDEELQSKKENIKDQFLELRFKENIKLAMPSDDSDVFDTVKLSWRISYISRGGATIFESGTSDTVSDATFPTTQTPGSSNDDSTQYNYPERIVLQYAEIRLGAGDRDMDLVTKATGGPGYETYNAGSSRIGSRDELLNPQVTGHLIAPYYENDELEDNGLHPSLNGYGFVNVKWIPYKDADGPDVGRYDSLHQLVTSEYLACFGEQMKKYAGTIIERDVQFSNDAILRPYMVFRTREYNSEVAVDVMITRLNWSMMDGYKFEGLQINTSRYDQANITQDEQKPRGPGGGRNPGRPGLAEKIHGRAPGRVAGSIDSNTSNISRVDDKVDQQRDDLEAQSFFIER